MFGYLRTTGLRCIVAAALVVSLAQAAGAVPQVWTWSNGSTTVTKEDNADWTLAANQDRITDNVWITRQDKRGLYNFRWEAPPYSYDYTSSPVNTEWAYGNAADWESLDFQSWATWASTPPDRPTPPDTVDQDAVLHLIKEDVYLDIRFTSWTSGGGGGGGGFSYDRATEGVPGEKVWTGSTMTFTKDDNADWTQAANQDAIVVAWTEGSLQSGGRRLATSLPGRHSGPGTAPWDRAGEGLAPAGSAAGHARRDPWA